MKSKNKSKALKIEEFFITFSEEISKALKIDNEIVIANSVLFPIFFSDLKMNDKDKALFFLERLIVHSSLSERTARNRFMKLVEELRSNKKYIVKKLKGES